MPELLCLKSLHSFRCVKITDEVDFYFDFLLMTIVLYFTIMYTL